MMSVQVYINMASALIMFVGGLVIVFFYPGRISDQYRVLIALFVTFYFLVRMGQAVLIIQRERRRKHGSLVESPDTDDDGERTPKRP